MSGAQKGFERERKVLKKSSVSAVKIFERTKALPNGTATVAQNEAGLRLYF